MFAIKKRQIKQTTKYIYISGHLHRAAFKTTESIDSTLPDYGMKDVEIQFLIYITLICSIDTIIK